MARLYHTTKSFGFYSASASARSHPFEVWESWLIHLQKPSEFCCQLWIFLNQRFQTLAARYMHTPESWMQMSCKRVCVCVCVSPRSPLLTTMCCADAPCMAGSGRVPGKEAGSGCLCLFCMWRREDNDPGTGLQGEDRREGGVMPQSYSFTGPRSEKSRTGHQVFTADGGDTNIRRVSAASK